MLPVKGGDLGLLVGRGWLSSTLLVFPCLPQSHPVACVCGEVRAGRKDRSATKSPPKTKDRLFWAARMLYAARSVSHAASSASRVGSAAEDIGDAGLA